MEFITRERKTNKNHDFVQGENVRHPYHGLFRLVEQTTPQAVYASFKQQKLFDRNNKLGFIPNKVRKNDKICLLSQSHIFSR